MTTRDEWIGRTGQEWARRSRALDLLLGPAGAAAIARLNPRPGERILDLGCGAGTSTLAIARAVGPLGHVTGIDVSPDLVALAREQLAAMPKAEIVEADAGTHPYGDPYDALHSRYGSMFFDDPVAALGHLRGALKPGARAVFAVWREPARNQWASVPMTFIAQGDPRAGPAKGPGPFAWADPDTFRPLLAAAGFTRVTEEPFEFMAEIAEGDDPDPLKRAMAFMMKIGPLAGKLRGATPEVKAEAEAFLARRLAKHVHDGAMRLRASAWIIEARG